MSYRGDAEQNGIAKGVGAVLTVIWVLILAATVLKVWL